MPFDSVRAEASRLLAAYLQRFPEESDRFPLLQQQLAAGENIFERSSMAGHVTSSAAVLNPAGTKILLIDHAFLQKWLPPGGHYEDGTLWESALREVAEETGVVDAAPHPWSLENGIPLDIDSHGIPARPSKNEGAHVHHDFRFVAVAPEHPELQAQLDEVHAAKWMPVDALLASPDSAVQRLHKKLLATGAAKTPAVESRRMRP